MKMFFRIAAVYVIVSFAITAFLCKLSMDLVLRAGIATYTFGSQVFAAMIWLLPLIMLMAFFMGWRSFVANFRLVGYVIFGSALLQTGFALLKSTIPMIVPFYADPWLADLDRWLHGGHDAWRLAHRWTEGMDVVRLMPVYLWLWAIPALALVLIIAISDRDRERAARFITLYLACWMILGNVVALIGSSAGPVYFDAILGDDRFAGLTRALASSGVTESSIGQFQRYLWTAYTEKNMAIGAGISAFPSVHVGIATITALYLGERSRWLILPGLAFLATILFLSVYTGYHYAVDGYFSVIFITGLWYALRRTKLTELTVPRAVWRGRLTGYPAGLQSQPR